ncbi:MAG: thioredoxin [Betaproteobacteria bacterium]|nr:thioredoxin [Betaproteobacteria bacterium]
METTASRLHVACPACGATNRVPAERMTEHPVCGKCKQALFQGKPVELNEGNFSAQLVASDIPLVVDFWAPWCGPCRSMAPHFERAASLLEPQVRLAKLNTEEAQATAARLGIRSIPTLIVFRNGREVARQSGAMDANSLVQWVREQV